MSRLMARERELPDNVSRNKESSPKISIIIPVYNIASYINRCIESILLEKEQVHEIILVDDGSTDQSPVICDHWAEEIEQILCIHKPNGGVSSARNAGLDAASGDYVFFVDGDDYISQGSIAIIAEVLNSEMDYYLFGYAIHQELDDRRVIMPVFEEGKLCSSERIQNLISRFMGSSLEKLYCSYNGESISNGSELGALWRMVIKRSVIEENCLRFDEKVHLAEDMLFAVEALEYSHSCQIVHKCIYEYCVRSDSATHGCHKHTALISNKKSLFQAREKLSSQFPELKEMYEGSAILSSVQVAMWSASKGVWDRKALKDFCEQPYIDRTYKKLSLSGSPLKYKVPFFLLKHKCYSLMLFAVKILNLIGFSMYGHI